MTNDRKELGILLGTAVGFGIGYYINSKKGQNMINESKNYMTDQIEKTKENSKQLIEGTTEYISELTHKGKSYLAKAERQLINNGADHKIEQVVSEELDALSEKLQMKKSELETLISTISNS